VALWAGTESRSTALPSLSFLLGWGDALGLQDRGVSSRDKPASSRPVWQSAFLGAVAGLTGPELFSGGQSAGKSLSTPPLGAKLGPGGGAGGGLLAHRHELLGGGDFHGPGLDRIRAICGDSASLRSPRSSDCDFEARTCPTPAPAP